jgi:hypothetical protein
MRVLERSSTFGLLVAALSLQGCGANGAHDALRSVMPTTASAMPKPDARRASAVIVPFDPKNFVAGVSNPFLPLPSGAVWSYFDGTETDRVVVTGSHKKILGVAVTEVHDQVSVDGSLTEDTLDWYAQDRDGNVWYFGEDSKELDHGIVVSTEGSWRAGQDGAMPGIVMLANPQDNDSYAQEHSPDVAEDMAKVVSLDETVTVPTGTYTGCLETVETTPLEPGVHEYKFYARGVGLVLELTPSGGRTRTELTQYTR